LALATLREKGQGALEYLLLIGGTVLIASLVIVLVTSAPGSINLEMQVKCAQKMNWGACTGDTDCVPREQDGTEATTAADFLTCGVSHCVTIIDYGTCISDTDCAPVDASGDPAGSTDFDHCTGT